MNNEDLNKDINFNNTNQTIDNKIESKSTVVISKKGTFKEKLFYLLFFITFLVFIIVTLMLVKTINPQLFDGKLGMKSNIPSSTPAILRPIIPTPVLVIATDSAILRMRELRESDEISDIEYDLENTEFTPIEENLKSLDNAFGFTAQ